MTAVAFRALVAGVGNIFLGDDGFGVEVARRLSEKEFPGWVRVADYGIRGMYLAHDLANGGYGLTILIDALDQGDPPGTVTVAELDTSEIQEAHQLDAHGMRPDVVLGMVDLLGAAPGRVVLVGCQPAALDEYIGLSPPVAAAVGPAAQAVVALIDEQAKELACAWASPGR